MDITILPAELRGCVTVPASKSFAHRELIAAALSDRQTILKLNTSSKDIEATIDCVCSLGAKVQTLSGDQGYIISPIVKLPDHANLFCNESGSTLRFMLPVTAALGVHATFTGAGRLPERPNAPLIDAMRLHCVDVQNDYLPITLSGKLSGGLYEMAGNISSQYITGLLMALPLLDEDSEIIFTTPVESAAYLDITCQVLHQFGIAITKTANGYLIAGKQRYVSPGEMIVEGDWSSAVFWHCANAMGCDIIIDGVDEQSVQGDKLVLEQIRHFGGVVNVSQTPDSLPALAVAACLHNGTTHFTGAARLRIKESDRLCAIADILHALGQDVTEEKDGLIIHGGKGFTGGVVNGCNDHRIVMAASMAACFADGPVTITDAEAVKKSYPLFFTHLKSLGGKIDGELLW